MRLAHTDRELHMFKVAVVSLVSIWNAAYLKVLSEDEFYATSSATLSLGLQKVESRWY